MSALGTLGRAEFDLLLDLLGEALAGRVRDSDVVETASTDGSLLIRLEPPVDGAETVLETAIGSLRTPDFVVTIIDAFAPTKDAAAS
jgi:hypothetical protein